MKSSSLFLLLLGSASYILFISVRQPEPFTGAEYDVRVINGFTNNSSLPLVIWCSSQGGDIGGRALQEGDDFGWIVTTGFWEKTRYFCTMKWDQKRRRFEAFQANRDSRRCAPYWKCSWLVKEDGFYFSNDEVNWQKDFSWS